MALRCLDLADKLCFVKWQSGSRSLMSSLLIWNDRVTIALEPKAARGGWFVPEQHPPLSGVTSWQYIVYA
jgi:hypothetical protein